MPSRDIFDGNGRIWRGYQRSWLNRTKERGNYREQQSAEDMVDVLCMSGVGGASWFVLER